jgi:hypothetical protein
MKIRSSRDCAASRISVFSARRLQAASNLAVRTASLLALGIPLIFPAAANAQSCRDEIARLESLLRNNPAAGLSAPQSVGATLHHQPTVGSVSAATREAEGRLEHALAGASKLASQGRNSECLAMLKTVDPTLGAADAQAR